MSFDGVREKVVEQLPALGELGARVKFDMAGEGALLVDARQVPAKLVEALDGVDCTIKMSAANMLKMLNGQLSPMMAFTLGKLKVDGSMGIAMKLAGLLDD